MKKTIIASLFGLAFTPLYANENIALQDIVVTAARVSQPRESVIADVTVINQEMIDCSGQSTLVDLLQMQHGIEVSNSGGLGKPASIFMRGTNSSHVVILIDGMRISSATFSTTAIENLPLAQFERIEILRGPATSLYGQDAIGGVIQLFTRKNYNKPSFYGSLGYGRYNTFQGDIGASGKVNDTAFTVGLSGVNTNGFDSIKNNNPNIQDNDGYDNLAVNFRLNQTIALGHELGMQFFQSKGETAFDDSFNLTNFDSRTKLLQRSINFTANNQWLSFWQSKLRVGMSQDQQSNVDEDFIGAIARSRFDTEQTQINWQHDFSLPVGVLSLMYDRLEEEVTSTTVYDQTERVNNGYVASYFADYGNHSFQTSFRRDLNSQFGQASTGNIGYGFKLSPAWRVSGSYGTAYKVPTFNDLYYPFEDFGFGFSYQGNPNLQPEKSKNKEITLSYNDGNTGLNVTAFENTISNLILPAQGIPADTAVNLGNVTIKGISLYGDYQTGPFTLGGSIDIQSPTDDTSNLILARRANRHAQLNLSYQLRNWRFGSEILASSHRFNDKANTRRLAGYSVLNLNTEYLLNSNLKIQARLNNVLNKEYTFGLDFNNLPYQVPGANLFVNLRWESK